MSEAIRVENLTRKFKEKTAVDALSFTVNDGEMIALLGVNGAGKTTTIKMLTCLLRPSAGQAFVYGHDVSKESADVKSLLGISPQESAVAPALSVRENLEMICGIYGMDRKEQKARAEEMLETLSLTDVAKQRVSTLSGGYTRRLSIAMALVTNPKILFLDEPTLGLDVLARRELWHFIAGLKGKMTILLTTHYLEEAEALADRILILQKGRAAAYGTAEEIKSAAGCADFEEAFVRLCGEGGTLK